MKKTELIIVASLTALMTAVGIKALSPEAKEMADSVQTFARVQDWKWEYASEISGHDYTAGIHSTINVEEVASAVRASGYEENPEIQNAAAQLETRFNTP
jgi:hypothetical protein